MKISSPLVVLISCWTLAIVINHSTGDSVLCLSCTYTFAGDGSTDLECVTDVENHIKTSVVNCTSGRCETRSVYTTEYRRLNSLYRGCLFEGSSISEKCDHPSSVYPTCEISCSTHACNNKSGDIWRSIETKDGGHNGGLRLVSNVNLFIIVSLVFLVCSVVGRASIS